MNNIIHVVTVKEFRCFKTIPCKAFYDLDAAKDFATQASKGNKNTYYIHTVEIGY